MRPLARFAWSAPALASAVAQALRSDWLGALVFAGCALVLLTLSPVKE